MRDAQEPEPCYFPRHTLDAGVGSNGYTANIGAEFGVAIDKNGNRMCYLGYCVSEGFALSLPPAPPASADVGVMMSFWGDAGSIPGTLNTIEFSVNAEFASFGITLDLIYMYAGSIGDFLGIGISAEIGPGKAALAGGVSLMTGKCDTPLCLTTCGEDCGGGRPTCGYTANAAAAKSTTTADVTYGAEMTSVAHPPSVGQGDRGTSDGTGILQIRSVDGKCLDASERSSNGGTVHMWQCDIHNENQQWTYNRATSQIKSRKGICLDASERGSNGGKIHMWSCNTNNANQQFDFAAGINRIKNQHGICVDASQRKINGGKVHMWSCDANNKNQMWTMQRCEVQDFLDGVNGWGSYGSNNNGDQQYGGAESFVSEGICTVSGRIKGGKWDHLATLPENCRPNKRLVFNLNNKQYTSRVDVYPTGRVAWVAGGKSHGWVSLSGITFAPGSPAHQAVPYNSGWVSYGGSYGDVTATVSGGSCMVSGLIKGSSWNHVATLPENCRPNRRLVFNLNNNEYTSRVDVDTDGRVEWVAGGKSHGVLSLTGITFTPEGSYRCT